MNLSAWAFILGAWGALLGILDTVGGEDRVEHFGAAAVAVA